jgi:hypothetical protein
MEASVAQSPRACNINAGTSLPQKCFSHKKAQNAQRRFSFDLVPFVLLCGGSS